MTKEELKKEAQEQVNYHTPLYIEDFIHGYLAGAEPREKQIQIDAEQIRALQKQNGELTDELKALRESIKDYGARCYENRLRNGRRKLEEQLNKAKELLKQWIELYKPKLEGYPITPIQEQTKQFLSEVEK